MTDIVPPEVRSRMMAGIKGRNTRPELLLRRAMHARGFRFRLHRKDLPGSPDLVFSRYRVAVFVHGCFWHRHEGCRLAALPKSRREFWHAKFTANLMRDRNSEMSLIADGWRVVIVWECALRSDLGEASEKLAAWIKLDLSPSKFEIGAALIALDRQLPGKLAAPVATAGKCATANGE